MHWSLPRRDFKQEIRLLRFFFPVNRERPPAMIERAVLAEVVEIAAKRCKAEVRPRDGDAAPGGAPVRIVRVAPAEFFDMVTWLTTSEHLPHLAGRIAQKRGCWATMRKAVRTKDDGQRRERLADAFTMLQGPTKPFTAEDIRLVGKMRKRQKEQVKVHLDALHAHFGFEPAHVYERMFLPQRLRKPVGGLPGDGSK